VDLRSKLIHLAYEKPEVRFRLLPILKKQATKNFLYDHGVDAILVFSTKLPNIRITWEWLEKEKHNLEQMCENAKRKIRGKLDPFGWKLSIYSTSPVSIENRGAPEIRAAVEIHRNRPKDWTKIDPPPWKHSLEDFARAIGGIQYL
jgi:hypothetical protein